MASGSWDNTIRIWDVGSGNVQATLNVGQFGVESLAFSPDGKKLASGLDGNEVKLWDVSTHKEKTLLDNLSQCTRSIVVFSPDGKTLASGGTWIHEIRLFDLEAGKQTIALKGEGAFDVKAISFLQNSKILASLDNKGVLKLLDRSFLVRIYPGVRVDIEASVCSSID